MIPLRITDFREAVTIVEQYKTRSTESNCFLMPDDLRRLAEEGCIFAYLEGTNAFILEDKGNCLRVHYMINNPEIGFSCRTDKPLMLELLFRGAVGMPEAMTAYWEREGFRRNLVRRNLSAKVSELQLLDSSGNDLSVSPASTDEEADFARKLFNSSFDPYSGDYLSPDEAKEIARSGRLLVAHYENHLIGALNFYTVGKCAWLGHVAVLPDARGKGAGMALVSEYIRRNHADDKSRFALWVQEQNIAATKMYDRLGFKYAGRSSLSMIKD